MIILFLSTVRKSEGKQDIVILFFQFLALEGWKILERKLLHTSGLKFLMPVSQGEVQTRFLHKYHSIPSLQLLLIWKILLLTLWFLEEKKDQDTHLLPKWKRIRAILLDDSKVLLNMYILDS